MDKITSRVEIVVGNQLLFETPEKLIATSKEIAREYNSLQELLNQESR